ncbi:MAG: sulfatase-like hydrolase/transferase [Planctomycetes bacterium]|nr:sulfatase-like hydrolase/transferase [Planctomycetota bacterium]
MAKTPNLLFLYCDEMACSVLGAYGNSLIDMPNLDRLAAQSTVFERAYVTQTVCTPSRSSLLTGLYPHTSGCTRNNVPLPADVPTMVEMIEPGRYVTAHHGKWHLGDEIFIQHGFDEWRSIDDSYWRYYSDGRDRQQRSSYHHFLIDSGFRPQRNGLFTRTQVARMPEEVSKPAYLAREASRFLRENKDKPFILYVNFFEPHMPFFGPRDRQYSPADVCLPPQFDAVPTEDQPLKTRLFHQHYLRNGIGGMPLRSENDWRRLIANYWGLASLVDTHVGTILETLSDCGLDDNTIVVFTSDHGDMMGAHKLVAKCVMFEEAARVPLMIRPPGSSEGRRIAGPVSHVDLVPTLLDLMGCDIPEHLEGESLRNSLEGSEPGRDVVIEWNNGDGPLVGDGINPIPKNSPLPEWVDGIATREEYQRTVSDPVRAIVTAAGWKFNCSPAGEHELYNLNEDPYETQNLASDPGHKPLMRELLGKLQSWQRKTADTVNLPTADEL